MHCVIVFNCCYLVPNCKLTVTTYCINALRKLEITLLLHILILCPKKCKTHFNTQLSLSRGFWYQKLYLWIVIWDKKCLHICNCICPKGQKNLKWFFQADVSSKKRNNKFDFTTCRLVFVHFLEESEDTKKTFRN